MPYTIVISTHRGSSGLGSLLPLARDNRSRWLAHGK